MLTCAATYAVTCAATQAAAGATAADLDAVMQLLAARRHGAVGFVEQQFLALLKRPLESSGELLYDAPGRLEQRTLEPHVESLVLEGDVLTVRRGHHTQVLDLQAYPQLVPLIASIRATLAGDRSALERAFYLEFSGDVGRWTLHLVPRDGETAKTVAAVQIDGAGGDLDRVEIRRADGDRSVLTLRARPDP